jgi:hypothetical protein
MQTKFNYTSGGEFKTSDNTTDYIGYFNVDDKENLYTEKYYSSNSILLENTSNKYSVDYYKSSYFKDRTINDKLSLPYSLEEVRIQPNELVNYNVLNTKIQYLHYNLIYMYSKMFMGDTDVPSDTNINILGNLVGSNEFRWNPRLATKISKPYFSFKPISDIPEYIIYAEYDNIKRFVVIPFVDGKGVSIIGISSTHLMALTSTVTNGQLSSAEFILYTNVIDNYSQERCLNLEDITHNGKFLYITDSKINGTGQLFKYDISSYYTNDAVFENKAFLVETIGGYGDINKKNKFNGCSVVGCRYDEVWVYDSGNNAIKVYDSNLVWKLTLRFDSQKKYQILDIRHREMNDHVYILYKNNLDTNNVYYGYFEYDNNYKLINTIIFEDNLYQITDGSFNRMELSKQDSNVFYVTTNSTVYKKFFSRPEKSFAVFDRDRFFPEDIFIWNMVDINWEDLEDRVWNFTELYAADFSLKDIFILDTNENKDDLFLLGNNFVSHLNENTNYISVLKHTNIPYYNYNRIKLENIEYNQSFVLNKEFYKLFQNIFQFRNYLKGRFYAEYNKYGDLTYKDYIYLSDDEINSLYIDLEYNLFINDNELVEPNVINRLFDKIYEFQLNLLNISEVKLKNYKTWVDLKYGLNIYPIE